MAVRPFRIASFCAGVAGNDLALRLAMPGAESVLYVEREAYAAALLAQRMAEGSLAAAPIWSDLGTFDGAGWRGRVDCVAAGLPCQPYSAAGKRRGHDDERAIWPEFMRIVGEMRPALVFLENVPPFLRYFQPVGERLSELGYRHQAGIFSAAEVGAPHLRERFFCLAVRGMAYAERQQGGSGHDVDMFGRWAGEAEQARVGRSPVANAERRQPAGRASGPGSTTEPGAYLEPTGPGGVLAHAEGGSGALRPAEGERLERLASACACKYGIFPPGPGDYDRWASILAAEPGLAPAITRVHRLAHGTARGLARGSRIDELRAAGNGVVPVVVALAFVTLARQIGIWEGLHAR